MYSQLVKFFRGELETIKSTNKTIYLSDGSQWNKHKFHQNLQLVRAVLTKQIDLFDLKYKGLQEAVALKELWRRFIGLMSIGNSFIMEVNDVRFVLMFKGDTCKVIHQELFLGFVKVIDGKQPVFYALKKPNEEQKVLIELFRNGIYTLATLQSKAVVAFI